MPIIVACPQCNGQLRVADDLIGRKVRCPACSATFDAKEPPPAPAPLPDLEMPTEKVDPWKSLNRELADDVKQKPPEPPPAPQPERAEQREAPPREDVEPRAPRRPRLNDDHDDLRPCRGCGRMVHRDARRCVTCGERLREDPEADDDIRYEQRRRKRDWEPHRAGFVLAMGIVSAVAVFMMCPVVGIVPGIMAWVMGSADLRKMRQGAMDPEGQGSTQAGWICGIVGTLLNTLLVLACAGFIGLIWFVEAEGSRRQKRAPFNQPPAPVVVPK